MDVLDAIANVRAWAEVAIETAVTRIFQVTQFAKSSEIGEDDAVESADENAPGENQRGQRPTVRSTPWGVAGRPTNKVRSVCLRLGASNLLFVGILPTEGYGPQNLKDGETAIWSAAVERGMHLTEDGDNKLGAASGQTVQVNGNDYKLPKWDHFLAGNVTPIAPGTPYASLAGALGIILTALTTPCVNGSPLIAPATPALANLTDFIARVSAAEYKSTKAENG